MYTYRYMLSIAAVQAVPNLFRNPRYIASVKPQCNNALIHDVEGENSSLYMGIWGLLLGKRSKRP